MLLMRENGSIQLVVGAAAARAEKLRRGRAGKESENNKNYFPHILKWRGTKSDWGVEILLN